MANTIPQPLTDALAAYEKTFTDAAAERSRMALMYGNTSGGLDLAIVQVMLDANRPKVDTAAQAVSAALKDATQAAEDAINAAINAAESGPDGAAYLQAITAFTAISGNMDQAGVAAKLAQALDAKLVAHSRAWADVARGKFPILDTTLAGLVDLADREAVDQGVLDAQAQLHDIQGIGFRFGFAAYNGRDRLDAIIQGGADVNSVGYRLAWVLGNTDQPNEAFIIRHYPRF